MLPALADCFPKKRKAQRQKSELLQSLDFFNIGKYNSMAAKIKCMNVVISPKFKYSHNNCNLLLFWDPLFKWVHLAKISYLNIFASHKGGKTEKNPGRIKARIQNHLSSLPFPEHINFRSYVVLGNVYYLQVTKNTNENFHPRISIYIGSF